VPRGTSLLAGLQKVRIRSSFRNELTVPETNNGQVFRHPRLIADRSGSNRLWMGIVFAASRAVIGVPGVKADFTQEIHAAP